MKYLAAFVASANAAAYTICSFTLKIYGTADSTCAGAAEATSTVLSLVNHCTFCEEKARWYKITVCTLAAAPNVKWDWHDSEACTNTAAAGQKTSYAAVATCVATNHDGGGSSGRYGAITSLAGSAGAAICGMTVTQHASNACTGNDTAAPTYPVRGFPAAGGLYIVGRCYYFGEANKYWKVKTCTSATVWELNFFTDKICSAGNAASGAAASIAGGGAASKCFAVFAGAKFMKINTITVADTVTQPAPAPAAAAAAAASTASTTTTDDYARSGCWISCRALLGLPLSARTQ